MCQLLDTSFDIVTCSKFTPLHVYRRKASLLSFTFGRTSTIYDKHIAALKAYYNYLQHFQHTALILGIRIL